MERLRVIVACFLIAIFTGFEIYGAKHPTFTHANDYQLLALLAAGFLFGPSVVKRFPPWKGDNGDS